MAQSTSIPDPNFEQALIDLNVDTDGLNGSISNADAALVYELDVKSKNISDLTGIEAFTLLQAIDCSFNNLTTLDLSSNNDLYFVTAKYNQLTTVNVNGVLDLMSLYIEHNQLTSLELSDNTNIHWLACFDNQLTDTLDISSLYSLESFSCARNQISYIKFNLNPNITFFNCRSNNINSLDFSSTLCGSTLEYLYVDSNQLHTLNLRNIFQTQATLENFSALENPDLHCISVDSVEFANAHTNWEIEPFATYALDCTLLEIEENSHLEVKLFPNPVKDLLVIQQKTDEVLTAEILDATGKKVRTINCNSTESTINMADLTAGLYLLRIDGETHRLVKE